MNSRTAFIASGLVILGGLVSAINSGCGDDDPTAGVPSRLARKGETCETSNDCLAGLACMPDRNGNGSIGVCVVGVFNIAPTAKECALIECSVAEDCCDDPPASCDNFLEQCRFELDGGFASSTSSSSGGTTTSSTGSTTSSSSGSTQPFSCQQYETLCVCDSKKRDCESGKCVNKCTADVQCGIGKCLGGKCGQCAGDDDCKGGNPDSELTCVSGECRAPCQGDGDCPGFDRCLQGKCVDSGCQTNRECVSATRNVEATCGTDGKCIVPCQTDLECGNPKSYGFFSCIGGQCLDTGCESDKDCRLRIGLSSSSGTTSSTSTSTSSTSSSSSSSTTSSAGGSGGLGSKTHVVCRDKPTPTTKPAQ